MKKLENRIGYRCATWRRCSSVSHKLGRKGGKEDCKHYPVHNHLFNCLRPYSRACGVRCIFVKRKKLSKR